ncbi:ferredoxin--NADP reductase [Microcella sp.]|uniref:ferredoxin--NADP reductase n=1 Tax=Microcella sp. TaxID=1913979 RepID=UPI00255EC1F4|nr:FAD-dependent oxidoreductase [Microcella sp.]MBX9471774.1 FAD-dependent oxidoreductase [Microcella sp.]
MDALTGRVSMYRLATITLAIVLVQAVLFAFLGAIGPDPYAILGTLGVVLVATLGANEVAARLARVVPHRESSVITALIITCIVQPSLTTTGLIAAAGAAVLAALSKYLIVWRGRHLLNPAATGVLIAGIIGYYLGQGVGFWWIATPALLPAVAVGALLLLDRTRRLDVGLVFIALTIVIIGARLVLTGTAPLGAVATVLQLFPVVFLAGFMLSEPQTLPPRDWQRWLTAAVVAVAFSVPFGFGPIYTSPELALVVGNIVAFAASRRSGFSVRVLEQRPLSPAATEWLFEPSRPVRFDAGQYLELHLPHKADIRGLRRTFSIASAPERAVAESEPRLAIGIRTPEGGSSFKAALASLEPGTRIAATQIAGDFVLPRDASIPLLLLAGGIGVTPFASQLASLVARGEQRDIVVVVVPSNPDEVLYRDTIEAAGARLVTLTRDELTTDALREAVPDLASRRAYVSGPPSVVAAARSALRRAGAKRVQTDYFAGY